MITPATFPGPFMVKATNTGDHHGDCALYDVSPCKQIQYDLQMYKIVTK